MSELTPSPPLPEDINLVGLHGTPADGKSPDDDIFFPVDTPVPSLPPLDENFELVSTSANDRHRQSFNKQVFTLDSGTLIVQNDPGRTSMTLTSARWNKIVQTLLEWGPRDEEGRYVPLGSIEDNKERSRLTLYRQMNKHGYEWAKVYKVEAFQDPSTGELSHRLRRICSKGNNRIALPMHKVFDVIHEAHCNISGHCGRDATYSVIKANFYNVSQAMVNSFIKECSVCVRRNVGRKNLPGAKKPIRSTSFRDRFQVDLIDMRSNPQPDVYGTEMKWIVTCKDHFTGFTGFFAIPKKEARFVVHRLEEFFAIIGYPKLFHTDNGKEFTAKSILEFLKSQNPTIASVTGRPRTPSDQGCVENMNKFGKKILHSLEDEERMAGGMPNWVSLLPRVTVAVNSFQGKGSKSSSAYEAVFGLKYHHGLPGTLQDLRDIHTVEEYLKVFPDSNMQRLANQFCLEGDVEDDAETKTGDTQDPDESIAKDPGPHEDKLRTEEESSNDREPQDDSITEDIDFSVLDKMKKFNPTKYGDEFNFAFPKFTCNDCSCGILLTIGDKEYFRQLIKTERWWDAESILSYALLAAHDAHYETNDFSVVFLNASYPKETIQERQMVDLREETDIVISLMCVKQHYALLEVGVNVKTINVYDGLGWKLTTWTDYANHVLVRCKLIDAETMDNTEWVTFGDKLILIAKGSSKEDPDVLWEMGRDVFILQTDGVSCGPIVTAKIFNALGIAGFGNGIGLDGMMGVRCRVVKTVLLLLKKYMDNMDVIDPTSEKWCLLCNEELTKPQSSRFIKCCSKEVHGTCMTNLLQLTHTPACPFCKSNIPADEVIGLDVQFAAETSTKDDNTDHDLRSSQRSTAVDNKRKRQDRQAKQMIERRAKYAKESGAALGALVRIGKDRRDVCNPRAAVGVIVDLKSGTGGIKVCTENGVISQGANKKEFWIPSDMYEVVVMADHTDPHPFLTPKLTEIRSEIIAGSFDIDSKEKLTLQQDQKLYLGMKETPKKGPSKGCQCGKGKTVRQCTRRCKCIVAGVACTSRCICNGNCSENEHNH